MPLMTHKVTVRQATSQDIASITDFMNTASLVHRHLDWRPLMEWVDKEPFLLYFDENELSALLSCAPDHTGIAWIHAFAASSWTSRVENEFQTLLENAIKRLHLQPHQIFSVALTDWFARLLKGSGFQLYQHIVVLNWRNFVPNQESGSPAIFIRPMTLTDVEEVAALDQLAFDPAWVISRDSLERVFLQSDHANVAELDNKIIGYELSSANHLSAHLVRLAVHPDQTRAKIGASLVEHMLTYFTHQGIWNITVNTQNTNQASLALYKKMGFQQTQEQFPVFYLSI